MAGLKSSVRPFLCCGVEKSLFSYLANFQIFTSFPDFKKMDILSAER